jgi:tetratricopeptide (TPR) repeat protein
MRWLAHLLVLLLAMPQARAEGGALCDRAAADPDAAIPACTQLIEHPPEGTNVAAAYNNRGVAKFGKGYLDDAIADFTSALNQNPKFIDAFKNRGLAYKMQGAADKAIDDFNKAIRLNGNSPELYNLRGAALLDKLEFNRAIADFEKAISLNQKYRNAFVNRGLAFVFTRQLSRAIADFDMVVRLSPRDPIGYLNRAMTRMDMGNLTGAIADYDEAIRLDPNTSGPYTRRGEAWRLQGNLQRSLDDHNKAIALNPADPEAYNNRALTFKDLGKLAEAIADCDQAIVLNKNSDFAYATRGLILQLQGNLWRSLTDLNKAVELKPNSPIALTFRGDTLRESGNISGAMEDFNKAILILPDFLAAYTGRGLTYEKKGEVAKAKADYEKALSLSAEIDAGLARPSKAKARERLAALAAAEAARAKEMAERAEQEVRAKAAAERAEQEARAKAAAERAEQEARAKAAVELAASQSRTVALPPRIPEDIQKVLQRRGHALLIGESHYMRGWDELASVRADLQALKAGLTPYFETVETMQDPTVSQLRDGMREFLLGKWNMADERLFIYYAGHGFTDFNQASRENNGYITGSDTPRYDLNPGKAIENAVPFSEIDSWNRQTRVRHVLMVFDSCFSGTLFQTMGSEEELRRKDLDGIRRMLGQPVRYYITSGRKEEVVTADSTFATLLLRGLRGEADFFRQGLVSADQLGIYLSRELPKHSQRPQTPQFSSIGNAKLSEGQFFFLTGIAATR